MTTPPTAEPVKTRALLVRLFCEYLRPQWHRLALAMLCAVAVALLTGFLMNILGDVVKRVFVQKRMDSLLVVVPLIVVAGFGRGLFQIVQAQLVNRLGHGIVGQMQARLFASLLHADLARLRQQHSGAYVSSVLYDAGLIREGLTTGVVNYTQNALIVAVMIGVMAAKDPYLTIVVLIAAPLASQHHAEVRAAAPAGRRKGPWRRPPRLSTAVMENLDGIKIVKIDNREAFEEGARRRRHRAAPAPYHQGRQRPRHRRAGDRDPDHRGHSRSHRLRRMARDRMAR